MSHFDNAKSSDASMSPHRPNILVIMADDHACKAISCYGGGINHTPNLDRIASDGMRLNHCYVSNSICTPSRAAILCGTHNHVNLVQTLDNNIATRLPNVAKQLRSYGGYQTAIVGKWHLGEGEAHQPSGFDYWDILPGQGHYHDPEFIGPAGVHSEKGYATDIITDKAIDFISKRDKKSPFFVMCHHKAPHRSWECHPDHKNLYQDDIKIPQTFNDDYKNRAQAAAAAHMKVAVDLTYHDLGLVQPDGGDEVGEPVSIRSRSSDHRKVPSPNDVSKMRPLIDKDSGEIFTFRSTEELAHFKYQRYMKRYLRTVQSIDENVGRMLNYLDDENLSSNTLVIYTSDQGFFLGEHGWFDKRFIYEESFQMPFLVRGPGIRAGSVCEDIVSNVDFAPTWLEFAGLRIPTYMQGKSFLPSLYGQSQQSDKDIAYHRYWMHGDEYHNAYAHYGIRSKRYKLIFWYNEGGDLPGSRQGGEDQEWELFDCEEDPLELFNLWSDDSYGTVRETMIRLLEEKMEEIGDEAQHPIGKTGKQLQQLYPSGASLGRKANQRNL
ncbi:hypothetical protein AYX14_01978 [Cryptococcus neoformans]|nr:hypothetical protein AYX14_01978 [Cryptococcus neoformans var. grubii]